MRLTYVRWSMTIIETMGLTLVTDPVFRLLGIRQVPQSYTVDQLPRPDLVFISHLHLDHFEPAVLRKLPAGTPLWMPVSLAAARQVTGAGLSDVRGVQEWQSDLFQGVRLTAVPARHKGGELGLVIEADRTVYFAGDTSLDPDLFRAIGNRWKLDAVFLPIGDLRCLGLPIGHLNPKRAPEALRLLGHPRVVVPTHYCGMTLGPFLSFRGTPRRLSEALRRAELGNLVGTTRPLETVEI